MADTYLTGLRNCTRRRAGLPQQLVLLLGLSLLPACSTVDLGEANKLAVAGNKTSAALQEEAALTASDLARNETRSWVTDALESKFGTSEESKQTTESSAKKREIVKLLKLRAMMLASLANAYKGFGELVNYGAYAASRDATLEFVGSANELFTHINTHFEGHIPLISDQAGALAGAGLGIIAEQSRRRDITRINLVLLKTLKKVKLALEAESDVAIALRQVTASEKARLRTALLDKKLADFSPVVQEFASLAGTTAAPDANRQVARNARSQEVVFEYIERQQADELEKIEGAYKAALATLDELIQQHEKLDKEKRVDISQLLTYAEAFKDAYGKSSK